MSDAAASAAAPAPPQRSPRRGMCAAILFLEAIVLGLTTPAMVTVGDVPLGRALAIGVGLCVLCIVVSGLLRAEWAYWLGWAIQVAAIGLGFLVSMMFVLGSIFAILWGAAYFLGKKIERERAEAYAAYDGSGASTSE